MRKHSASLLIPPGETIADCLESRNMSEEDLQKLTGAAPDYIRAMLRGEKAITPSFAERLEKVFGVPVSFWIRLQKNFEQERKISGSRSSSPRAALLLTHNIFLPKLISAFRAELRRVLRIIRLPSAIAAAVFRFRCRPWRSAFGTELAGV